MRHDNIPHWHIAYEAKKIGAWTIRERIKPSDKPEMGVIVIIADEATAKLAGIAPDMARLLVAMVKSVEVNPVLFATSARAILAKGGIDVV